MEAGFSMQGDFWALKPWVGGERGLSLPGVYKCKGLGITSLDFECAIVGPIGFAGYAWFIDAFFF